MLNETESVEELLTKACSEYKRWFKCSPTNAACAPGRVNLIGEHTDYNDGYVLPMALPLVTVAVGGYNNSEECTVVSLSESVDNMVVTFKAPSIHTPLKPGQPGWANYVKGVVANFPGELQGFNVVIISSVPIGGGLSSSASLEVAMFTFLENLTGRKCDAIAKALACQKAENQFAGMPCGIMDQFISTMGKKDNALLIDCKSLESTLVEIKDEDIVILITNSNVKHQLTGSEYPTRRTQCHNAAAQLGKISLRDATIDDIEELRRINSDQIVINRAQHVITEIRRTEEAAECLRNGDFKRVGELFYESHESLRDLFEVSCDELDELVEAARSVPGVLGSRMTGGGFGGCTVTLVHKKHVKNLIETIKSKYSGKPTFYLCRPCDGARELSLPAVI